MATTALTLNASSNPKSEAQSALGPSKASLTTAASAADDFGTALDELLDQLRSKVAAVSEEMLAKMDDMSRRLDNLESSLRAEAGTSSSGQDGEHTG